MIPSVRNASEITTLIRAEPVEGHLESLEQDPQENRRRREREHWRERYKPVDQPKDSIRRRIRRIRH